MADYVLVHGGDVSTEAWDKITKGSPVHTENNRMGCLVWESVAHLLRVQGHRVSAPTLKNARDCDLAGHIEQICTAILSNGLRDIVLTGHSYAGMVITGVADRMPERIRRLVYLDAAFPDPGQSLFDMIAEGGCDPGSIAGLEALPPYLEKLRFDLDLIESLPKTYIRCMNSEFMMITDLVVHKIAAGPKGWIVKELAAPHMPQAVMPDELAQILLDAARTD